MKYQQIFRRYELKYLLTPEQQSAVRTAMQTHMEPDEYWKSTVRSLYFDTENYRLARHSIEHPPYKEKLRLRSYCQVDDRTPVFAELKKKYQSVVYKRRVDLSQTEAFAWICEGMAPRIDSQISQEIGYFIRYYETLHPAALVTYDREAYRSREGTDLRITFDSHILARDRDLSLASDTYGQMLLPEDKTIMEIKTAGGMPLWLVSALSANHIYKTTFSKYGTAYQTILYRAPARTFTTSKEN